MRDQQYRIAIIGRTGRGDYGHALDIAWKSVPGTTIVAVADEDETGRAQAMERLGAHRGYADYREMLQKEEIDIVSVAPRWADCHLDMITACAERGIHVMTEKPLARSLVEADRLVEICEQNKVKVAVAQHIRYTPEWQHAQELITAGAIGEILEIRGRGKEDARGGGEDFTLLGSHILDMFRMLLGTPLWCFGRVLQDGHEACGADVHDGNEGLGLLAGDRVDAVFGFEAAPLAHFSSVRGAANPTRFGVQILGTEGALAIDPGNAQMLSMCRDVRWGREAPWQAVPVQAGEPNPQHWIAGAARMACDLVQSIEDARQPLCSIYDARAIMEMGMALFQSHCTNAPAQLPLTNRENPLSHLQ